MKTHVIQQSEPLLWQRLLTFGNECYEKQNWLQAEYYYKEAELQLDYLWSAEPTNINLLMAWICTLHNLSTLFEQQGDKQIGLRYLLIPHHRMLNLTQSKQATEDVKLIAIKALKLTFPPILVFSQKNPICNDCKQSIQAFQQQLESQQEVVH
ncbi:hypothetical protein [Pseudocolwellia agarivorans]|uniref:hypothetical protein n=1 Tax=Pseudocolwellia agarivorans TaxID=1911682 RepID=UPI000985CD59|nr:hypothetical protein [Pseudocolwellia agarivorans]